MAILHVKTPNGVTKAYDLDNMGGIPVGFEHFSMNPNVPQGWLPLLGGEYNRATYSDLWAWVQSQTGYLKTEAQWQALSNAQEGNVPFYSSGNGSTTFRVPSLKCWIKGKDGSENVGTYLSAGLPNISGNVDGYMGMKFTEQGPNVFSISNLSSSNQVTSEELSYHALNFNAEDYNDIYGNADTVVPKSIVGMWLVKAYGIIEDTGSINEQQYIDDKFNAAKTYIDTKIGNSIPIGIVQPYSAGSLPTGWLLCDGSAVSRTTYSALYGVIGTTYGTGNGSSTFNLPNLIDRFIQGNTTVGTYINAGLPNITGTMDGIYGELKNEQGVFFGYSAPTKICSWGWESGYQLGFDASRSNSIYKNESTVQPPALTMRYIIKY